MARLLRELRLLKAERRPEPPAVPNEPEPANTDHQPAASPDEPEPPPPDDDRGYETNPGAPFDPRIARPRPHLVPRPPERDTAGPIGYVGAPITS